MPDETYPPHDWADFLAEQMARDASISVRRLVRDLWAARLRVLKESGVGEGLKQAREAIAPSESAALSLTPQQIQDINSAVDADLAALRRFHNALRILRSIDLHELQAVGVFTDNGMLSEAPMADWARFRDRPYEYLIKCPDGVARRIWHIIEGRQLKEGTEQ